MPIYIVGEGSERYWNGRMGLSKMLDRLDGYWMETPQTVMTTRAPQKLTKQQSFFSIPIYAGTDPVGGIQPVWGVPHGSGAWDERL